MRNSNFKRLMAWLLIAALVGTMIISVIVSAASGSSHDDHDHYHAHAEEDRESYAFDIEFMEDEQALRVTQRLAFYNDTGDTLDRVMFAVYANMFRRESTVMYETAEAMPYGFSPGGVEFYSVKVNGVEADWAVQGAGEYFMRVDCDIAPEHGCEFEFVYDVLLTQNAAFIGVDQGCWRISGFYPTLCVYNEGIWEGNVALQHTRYTLTDTADYTASITLPDMYDIAATGTELRIRNDNGTSTWEINGENIREFAITIGRAWRCYSTDTESGTEVRVFTSDRSGGSILDETVRAVEFCEDMFGRFPVSQLDIVETDLAVDRTAFAGCIWLDRGVFSDGGDELIYNVRRGIAEQYFGISVYSDPVAKAWLGESVPEYVTYLIYDELEGHDVFTQRMNLYFMDAINVTIPAALVMNTDAAQFTQSQYTTVVRHRGAMAMHELCVAMGHVEFIDALSSWYQKYGGTGIVDEFDFLSTLKTETGYDWENFLTELIFNLDEYSYQYLDWYE